MAGRPPKNYDEKIIKDLVIQFHEEQNTNSIVKPIDMHKFASKLHENGSFPYKTSYDYWKRKGRQGRELIEEFNAVRTDSYSIKEGVAFDIVDVEDLLNKHGVNKDELSKYLIPMERQIRSLVNQLESAKDKIHTLERENFDLINQLKDEKEHSDKLQTLLYQLFTYSASGATLDNIINTGTSRTERVSLAMKEVFSEPTKFLKDYKNHIKNFEQLSGNIISFEKKTSEKNDENEWDL